MTRVLVSVLTKLIWKDKIKKKQPRKNTPNRQTYRVFFRKIILGKARVSVILHIVKREQWEKAKLEGVYHSDTLDTYGFIHCSTSKQIVKVANDLFFAQKGLVLLCIVTSKVRSKIRYEFAGSEELYPHIYGPLNIDAVIRVADFEPAKDGTFRLPKKCML